MSGGGDGAGRLGERLLGEVEVDDLSSVLKSLREVRLKNDESTTTSNQPSTHRTLFNIPGLTPPQTSPHILELVSPPRTHHPSSAAKTQLLYLLITHAILPAPAGEAAAIILFDPLNHFSVPRLVQVMLHHLHSRHRVPETTNLELQKLVEQALPHLHIFRPQTWSESLRALRSLPTYLFDPNAHASSHRHVAAIVLEDIEAFDWEIRTQSRTLTTGNPFTLASAQLTSALVKVSSALSCGVILTSTSSSTSNMALRPTLPTSWPEGLQPTRIGVRRVEVLKFAPGMSVEEAEAERGQRREVVRKGRFEWWKVGSERESRVFRVGEWGVEFEKRDEE